MSELADDFAAVYRAHLDAVIAFCYGRTRDAELAADLAAEVFASALVARERYRSDRGTVRQWRLGIAAHKAADAARRGRIERRAQQRLGMSQIFWTGDDLQRVERIGRAAAPALMNELPGDQRRAVQARVLEELEYGEIARQTGTSEQVIRKRVSRGLATATTADRRISMSGLDHLEQELRAARRRQHARGHARLRPLPMVPLLALVAIFVGALTIITLATLARSQRTADRLPPRIIGPPNRHVYPYGTYPPMTGIYVRYIRKARHRFGATTTSSRPPTPTRSHRSPSAAMPNNAARCAASYPPSPRSCARPR